MLYRLLKAPARLALLMYCRSLKVSHPEVLNLNGPLLIAANHPNSFLDAVIIATIFKRPVYSLVRGDVYVNSFMNRLLTALKMMPVYRLSEGAENLGHNYNTFTRCREVFKNNGIVLIFSEGRCINEWKLRPLKKGTARLAISSWEEGIPLKILPAGINYQSFKKFGKNVIIHFGEAISENDIDTNSAHGHTISFFNQQLEKQLRKLVIEADKNDSKSLKEKFYKPVSIFKKSILFLPACLGYLFHIVPYLLVKYTLGTRFRHNDHYDSVMVAGMFFIYPFILAAYAAMLYVLKAEFWWLSIFLIPFSGWSYLQLKKQL